MHRLACTFVMLLAAMGTMPRSAGAQSATWPRVEFGGRVSHLTDGESMNTIGPKVLVNLTSRTAITAAADFQMGSSMGSQTFQGNHNFLFVGVRRVFVSSPRTAGFIVGGLTRWWYDDEASPADVAYRRSYFSYAPTGTRNIVTFGGGVRWEVTKRLAVEFELDGEFNGNYNFARFTSGVTIPVGSYPGARPETRKFGVPTPQGPSVRSGQRVWATLADGREVTGKLVSLSATAVDIVKDGQVTSTPLANVRKIEQADSDGNGLLLGAGVGVAAGFLGGYAACASMSECGPGVPVVFAGIGAGIGIAAGRLIDAFIVSRETVYDASGKSPKLVLGPVVTPHGLGAAGSVRW